MVVSSADITAWLGGYLWPFFRIGAALGAVPVIGTRLVPVRVRLGLALALTALIAPLVPPAPAVDLLSMAGALLVSQQILIGAAMGLALHLVFSAFVHAGQVIAMQMGLGFASMIDPQNGVAVPVLSQFYMILVTLLFFALDGHHVVIEVLADSFHTLPPAAHGFAPADGWALVQSAGWMFAGALRVALPAVTALLFVNIAFGVMMRTAPQLNIFAVGFPISMILGFAVILFTLPGIAPQLDDLLTNGFELMRRLTAGD
jgi:flagellar biosynthetic protein FliR